MKVVITYSMDCAPVVIEIHETKVPGLAVHVFAISDSNRLCF